MVYCPNCGTPYEAQPTRCQCGFLFGTPFTSVRAEPEPGRFSFTGEGARLLVLYVKLFTFSIFTLGIYSFWGRAEIRKYLWSNTHFAGQPFAFHGTGKELFIGFLKLIGIILGLGIFMAILVSILGRDFQFVVSLISILTTALLLPFALHGTLRYRWSRTSWQGRRFAYRGDLMQLAMILIPGLLLTAITFFIYLPFFLINLRRYITENTWFGGQQMRFEGDGRDLLWSYLKMLLLLLPTLGLYRFWFRAEFNNYTWNKTRFAGIPFRSTMRGFDLLLLAITNALLIFFTLGIGTAWATCRSMSYWAENLQLEQLPRVQLLTQAASGDGAFGESMGEAMGIDAGIDAGLGL